MPKLKILLLLTIFSTVFLVSAGVHAGSAGCFNVVSELQRNWMDVERHLVPMGATLEGRPSNDQFVCVSNYTARNALERTVGATSGLRCFRQSADGLGFCCDENVYQCAGMNPGLFAEHLQGQKTKQESYEPPKSGWVRPPADGDQWKSN